MEKVALIQQIPRIANTTKRSTSTNTLWSITKLAPLDNMATALNTTAKSRRYPIYLFLSKALILLISFSHLTGMALTRQFLGRVVSLVGIAFSNISTF